MPVDLLPMEPVALICAVLADAPGMLEEGEAALSAEFGAIDRRSAPYPFSYSSYYEREMGAGLVKRLFCFERRVDPAELPGVKRRTMALEKRLGRRRGEGVLRRVNIDPGLLSIESLVLATTKYSGHRICIDPGLYAEVTLLYRKGSYAPFEWSYPDFRSAAVQDFLLPIRAQLLEERRARKG